MHPSSAPEQVRRLTAILFDLDGTLVDSERLIYESWRHTMETHFGEVPPEDVWRRTLGRPLRSQFGELVETAGEVRAMIDTYVKHNLAAHEKLIRTFPGARETLEALRSGGLRLGIVTSKATPGTKKSLAACSLDEALFDVIVTSDEPVPPKPDAAPVRLALERLGIPAEDAAFVGDSVWDMRAGRAAGVTTVAALWGPFSERELAPERPDLLLDSIEELLPPSV